MMLRVEVTSEDIQSGKRGNARHCPIALAIEGALRQLDVQDYQDWQSSFAAVFDSSIEQKLAIEIPESVRGFVNRYDLTLPVKPFSFDLEVPDNASAC